MINLKKIGLTALAGSLVAFSANAVELGVTGGSEITYTSNGGDLNTTGNRFGAATSMKFSGSGDVGFGTATIVRTLRDNQSAASYSSAYTTLDLGDMGVLSFDTTGGALVGTAANDDLLPTAYEEVWHAIAAGNGTVGIGAKNVLGYRHTIMGVSLSAGYSASDNGTGNGDGATSSFGGTGSTWDANVSTPVPYVEGLTFSGGFADKTGTDLKGAGQSTNDTTSWTSHLLYDTGPWSMGVRMAANQKGSTNIIDGGAGVAGETATAGSVAYNVNDALTVSYAQQDVTYEKLKDGVLTATADTPDVTETSRAFNAAYTMGAATVRGTLSKASDKGGVTGSKDEHMEISLVLSF